MGGNVWRRERSGGGKFWRSVEKEELTRHMADHLGGGGFMGD